MTARAVGERPRIVIAGSGFGRVYLAAVTGQGSPYELAGILARGSDRSRACAEHYGVPLLTEVGQVGADVALAAVAVGSAMTGGAGARITEQLMERDIHVLHEHPVHPDEVTAALRLARRQRLAYRINTLHADTAPVQDFLAAARRLRDRQPFDFVEVTCAFQTAYATLDVLARLLGGLRPWRVAALVGSAIEPPYAVAGGSVAGTPVAFRIQDDLDALRPDNHLRQLFRISVASPAGLLTLLDSAGPVVWSPQAHVAEDTNSSPTLADSASPAYAEPVAGLLGGPLPTRRELLGTIWPDAVRRRLDALAAAARDPDPTPPQEAQRMLSLAQAANELARLVPPRLVAHDEPELIGTRELFG